MIIRNCCLLFRYCYFVKILLKCDIFKKKKLLLRVRALRDKGNLFVWV